MGQDADGSGTIDCDEFDQTFVLKAKFAEIDTDGSGELDASELATLFESMGKPVSVRSQRLRWLMTSEHARLIWRGVCWQVGTLTNLLRLSDADGSGTIDFDEFAAIVNACH